MNVEQTEKKFLVLSHENKPEEKYLINRIDYYNNTYRVQDGKEEILLQGKVLSEKGYKVTFSKD